MTCPNALFLGSHRSVTGQSSGRLSFAIIRVKLLLRRFTARLGASAWGDGSRSHMSHARMCGRAEMGFEIARNFLPIEDCPFSLEYEGALTRPLIL